MNASNLQRVREHIARIMPRIEKPAVGRILHPWLSITHGEHYAQTIFGWDFHHAAMRMAVAGKPQYLRFFVENLLAYQLEDGHTPNVIYVDRGPRYLDPAFHAQPFLFQAALLYVAHTDDTRWGQGVFDKLVKYLRYYDKTFSAAHGLKRWRTGWMGGLDNDVVTAFLPPDSIASCEINGWLHLEHLAAERLAKRLERADDAETFAQLRRRHQELVNDKLWCEPMQTYAAYDLAAGETLLALKFDDVPSQVGRFAFQSASNLVPLYARMAEPSRAEAMIRRYLLDENHFWGPCGVRSLSKSSEYYNNAVFGNPSRFGDHRRMTESNWQGPVWSPINYFAFHALRHYGFAAEAATLADRLIDTLAASLRTQGSFAENFHGETGRPLYARCIASWNLLADTLHDDLASGRCIMDVVFGESPAAGGY